MIIDSKNLEILKATFYNLKKHNTDELLCLAIKSNNKSWNFRYVLFKEMYCFMFYSFYFADNRIRLSLATIS